MKTINNIVFLMLASFLIQSCDYSDVNDDPTKLSGVSLSLMLPELEVGAVFNYGTNPGRVAGIWMQQLEGIDAQQLAHNRYLTPEDAMNNYWRTGLYVGTLSSATVIIDQAQEEGSLFYSGVAKIIMANELGLATSFFGDLPLSEAFQGVNNLQPSYDSQESIFAEVFRLLEEGTSELSGGGYTGGDIIFGGDADAWAKTAKAFEARFRLMMGKRDASNYSAALAAVNASYASAADDAIFTFGTAETQNYSLAKFGTERPSTITFNAQFADMLSGDPRLAKYASEDGAFHVSGSTDLTWSRNDASVPLVSYAEMMFIKAEVEARNGDDADASLAAAVRASMALSGVDDADAVDAYVGGLGSASVETVITEAYKAYYGFNFHQTWSNWRRTGFPNLTAVSNAAPDFNPSLSIPQRYLYVDSESTTNPESVQAAKDRQGGALLDATLWVFQ